MKQKLATALANAYAWQREVSDLYRDKADERVDNLLAELPHGSGIDGDWSGEYREATDEVVLFNSYHHMNEGGYYDGWTAFKVSIKSSLRFGLDVKIVGSFPRKYADTRGYLADTMLFALSEEVEY